MNLFRRSRVCKECGQPPQSNIGAGWIILHRRSCSKHPEQIRAAALKLESEARDA